MTDYTSITGVPVGQNAFTAHAQGVLTARDYSLSGKNMRRDAERVNPHSGIALTGGPTNSAIAPR